MAQSISDFIYHFMNIFCIPFVTLVFFNKVQKEIKYNKWVVIISIQLLLIIVGISYEQGIFPRSVFFIVYQLSVISYSLFMFKGRLANKLVNLIAYYILSLILDYITYLIVSTMSINKIILMPVSTSVFTVFYALSLYFASDFLQNIRAKKVDKKAFIFLLIPLSHAILILCFGISQIFLVPHHEDIFNSTAQFNNITACGLIAGFTFALLVDIFSFRQYIKSLDAAQIKAENEALEYKNKLNTDYFNELKENETELRKIKHDISGCLETIQEILYTEKDIEMAQEFFDEMSQNLGNITTGFYCRNSLINAIIISKSKICTRNNVNLDVDISVPGQLNISDIDVCRALVNILDNAIESAIKSTKEKFVKLSIKENDGFIYIYTENPYDGEAIGATTKTNKKEHGFGLKILNDFAQKYDGYFNTEIKNSSVCSLITMRNETR